MKRSNSRRGASRVNGWLVAILIGCVLGGIGCGRSAPGKEPGPNAGTNAPANASIDRSSLKAARVSMTNSIMTTMRFQRTTPPPWTNGNTIDIQFEPTKGQLVSWRVVNMHAENLGEISRRLGINELEMLVLHLEPETGTVQETGKPERKVEIDRGYAVVSDARIPREWFLSTALGPPEIARELEKACPEFFRPLEIR